MAVKNSNLVLAAAQLCSVKLVTLTNKVKLGSRPYGPNAPRRYRRALCPP